MVLIACVFYFEVITDITYDLNFFISAVIDEIRAVSPLKSRLLDLCFIDRPCAAVDLRCFIVQRIARCQDCSCYVLARLNFVVILILYVESFREPRKIDAMLSSVICERFFIVPVHAGDIESLLIDLPLAVSRLLSLKRQRYRNN